MRLRCDAQIGSPSMSQAAPESPTSGRRKDKSPRVPHCPSAGIGGGVGGKLAVELAQKGDGGGEAKLGAGGIERGVLGGRSPDCNRGRHPQNLVRRRMWQRANPLLRAREPSAQR